MSEEEKYQIYETIVADKYSYILKKTKYNTDETLDIIIDVYIYWLENRHLERYVCNSYTYNARQRQKLFKQTVDSCISDYYKPLDTGKKYKDELTGKTNKQYAKKVEPTINEAGDEIDVFDSNGCYKSSAETEVLTGKLIYDIYYEYILTCGCSAERIISYIYGKHIIPFYTKKDSPNHSAKPKEVYKLLYNKKMGDIILHIKKSLVEMPECSILKSDAFGEFEKEVKKIQEEKYIKNIKQITGDIFYVKRKVCKYFEDGNCA